MDDIIRKLEQAGIIMESNRLSQKSLSAADRAAILEARMLATQAGWPRHQIELAIEEGRCHKRTRACT